MVNKKLNPKLAGRFPLYGWIGLLMCLLSWWLNWDLEGLRTHWLFFPLWLGFILFIDALTFQRKQHSLFTRNPGFFVLLFVLSIPFWWLFEWLNRFTGFWQYHPREAFSALEFFLLSSLNFSVVIPAMFAAAEWVGSFRFINSFSGKFRVGRRKSVQVLFLVLGVLMLGCVFVFPDYSPAFLWMAFYFLLDPLNKWLGFKAILNETAVGDWRKVFALWIGSLICGFCWELWNYYAWPKWTYEIPFLDFWKVFEMPLFGYLGYLPFSLELYAIYQFVAGIFRSRKMQHYLRIIEP